MSQLIKQLRNIYTEESGRGTAIATVIVIFALLAFILEIVARVSDIGFGTEVAQCRIPILLVAASASILTGIFISFHFRHQNALAKISTLTDGLNQRDIQIGELEQLNRLLRTHRQHHEAIRDIDVLLRLKLDVYSSIMAKNWQKSGARIERFRIDEKLSLATQETESIILERITVFITLGRKERVLEGMRFIVQDATDELKYGTIVVERVGEDGSSAKIVDIENMAFWRDVILASRRGEANIIPATPNVIVPWLSDDEKIPRSVAKYLFDYWEILESKHYDEGLLR